MTQVWQRFPCDSEESYGIFCEWIHQPPEKRADLELFCRHHARFPHRVMAHFAESCMWAERAAAYDEWSAQSLTRRVYPITNPILIVLTRILLKEIRKFSAAQDMAGDVPGFDGLSIKDIGRLYKMCADAEIQVHRLQKDQEEAVARGDSVLDITKLTLEEQRTMDLLLAKCAS